MNAPHVHHPTAVTIALICAVVMSGVVCQAPRVRIATLGDSLSTCTGLNRAQTKGVPSFRLWLWRLIQHDGFETCATFVGTRSGCNAKFDAAFRDARSFPQEHDAVFGRTTLNALKDLGMIKAYARPNVVMLLLGTNDFLLLDRSVSETVETLKEIVRVLRRNETAVLWSTVPAIHPPKIHGMQPKVERVASQIDTMRNAVIAAAQELNTTRSTVDGDGPIFVVDTRADFDARRLTYDGIHASKLGAARLATIFYQQLKPVLERLCAPTPGPIITPSPDEHRHDESATAAADHQAMGADAKTVEPDGGGSFTWLVVAGTVVVCASLLARRHRSRR